MDSGLIDDLPAVAAYGDTMNQTFPLVLIFGREYNNEGCVKCRVGNYDFIESPRSIFWNRSYRFLQRHTGINLKTAVMKRGYSPIMFTNALPTPIPNNVANKEQFRSKVTDDQLDRYIEWIFSASFFSRVQCVIVSVFNGPGSPTLIKADKIVTENCEEYGVPLIHLPYLGSRESNRYIDSTVRCSDSAIYIEEIDVLRKIIDAFPPRT